ncbi:hypothetical protein F8517_25270 [Bacillus thuringiensis]|uniref:HNH endonuclease signature motif containing protein n=1 Tax=Bacillus thuringiensis TaxID=1428 RepID=UPI00124F4029|nr:HNH endonuclease signature motif containing protein [Bacillus thuringiensis]KAB2364218.1 hypothetical protein F8517_25270 [Bacillus thuringiensis]
MKKDINRFEWEGNAAITLAAQVVMELDNINELDVRNWIDLYEIDIKEFCVKPQKFTILHQYIEDIYVFGVDYILDKHFPGSVIGELIPIFDFYKVDYSCVGKLNEEWLKEECSGESFEESEEYANQLWLFFKGTLLRVLVHEVFTILYMNKNFLYEFNLQLSEKIRELKVSEFPSILKKNGVIARGRFPVWLKDGVKFRDKGRCQICGTDLTRTFNRDSAENYDHIIPLELNGSNDPINIQLTCESCNKSKGARNTKFVNSYAPFWEL